MILFCLFFLMKHRLLGQSLIEWKPFICSHKSLLLFDTHTFLQLSFLFILFLKVIFHLSALWFFHFSQLFHFGSFFSPLCIAPILGILSHSMNRSLSLSTCWSVTIPVFHKLTDQWEHQIRGGGRVHSTVEVAEKDGSGPIPVPSA